MLYDEAAILERVRAWLANLPEDFPTQDDVPREGESLTPGELTERLARFGAALVWLRAQHGLTAAKARIFREAYEHELALAKRLADVPPRASEAAKEAAALDGARGGRLRSLLAECVEVEALATAQKGLIDAYTVGWETVSRLITASGIEVEISRVR